MNQDNIGTILTSNPLEQQNTFDLLQDIVQTQGTPIKPQNTDILQVEGYALSYEETRRFLANLPHTLDTVFTVSRSQRTLRFPLPGISRIPAMMVTTLNRDGIPFELQFFDELGRCPNAPAHNRQSAQAYLDALCPEYRTYTSTWTFGDEDDPQPIAWIVAPLAQSDYDRTLRKALLGQDRNLMLYLSEAAKAPQKYVESLEYDEDKQLVCRPFWTWNLSEEEIEEVLARIDSKD